MTEAYENYADDVKLLRTFYPHSPHSLEEKLKDRRKEQKDKHYELNANDAWDVLKHLLADAFEEDVDRISRNNHDILMKTWKSRVKAVIDYDDYRDNPSDEQRSLFDRINELRKRPLDVFSDSINNNPRLDADAVTAKYIFDWLPFNEGERDEVTINDLIPMYKTNNNIIIKERQDRFKAFIDVYKRPALMSRFNQAYAAVAHVKAEKIIRERKLQQYKDEIKSLETQLSDLNAAKTKIQTKLLTLGNIDLSKEIKALEDNIQQKRDEIDANVDYMVSISDRLESLDNRMEKVSSLIAKYRQLELEMKEAFRAHHGNSKIYQAAKKAFYKYRNRFNHDIDWYEKRLDKLRNESRKLQDEDRNHIRWNKEAGEIIGRDTQRLNALREQELMRQAEIEQLRVNYHEVEEKYGTVERQHIIADGDVTHREMNNLQDLIATLDAKTLRPQERIYNNIQKQLDLLPVKSDEERDKIRDDAENFNRKARRRRIKEAVASIKQNYPKVDEWIQKHTFTREEVKKKADQIEQDIKDGKEIHLDDYTDDVRIELNKRFDKIVDDILDSIPANGAVQMEIASSNNNVRKLNLNYEQLRDIFDKWKSEGFEYKFEEFDEHMSLTEGDRKIKCPVWALKYFKIQVANVPHAAGGNFCPYILRSNDAALVKYCKDVLQIYDHIPTRDEPELLEPCLIHSIICGLKRYRKDLVIRDATDIMKGKLREFLYSRIRTRFVPLSGLHKLCNEV